MDPFDLLQGLHDFRFMLRPMLPEDMSFKNESVVPSESNFHGLLIPTKHTRRGSAAHRRFRTWRLLPIKYYDLRPWVVLERQIIHRGTSKNSLYWPFFGRAKIDVDFSSLKGEVARRRDIETTPSSFGQESGSRSDPETNNLFIHLLCGIRSRANSALTLPSRIERSSKIKIREERTWTSLNYSLLDVESNRLACCPE